ncbi:MAG: hypothetical protein LYZ69_05565 [Nitrososphaerales archaeon]|nr:hypothetical protein [Nitrososphaerales archaeon]
MIPKEALYGAIAVLLATSLLASSLALNYYNQYQQQSSEAQSYAGELRVNLGEYRSLSSSYQVALKDYNSTISLLSQAVSGLNTSSPTYARASLALALLWRSYLNLSRAEPISAAYSVNVFFEFGNGTRRWFNETAVQPGWNAYIVTLVVVNGKMQATWYPSYGEHFVTGLAGIQDDPAVNRAWLLWTWDSVHRWQTASVGADQVPALNGTVFAWTYCSYNPSTYAPLCAP